MLGARPGVDDLWHNSDPHPDAVENGYDGVRSWFFVNGDVTTTAPVPPDGPTRQDVSKYVVIGKRYVDFGLRYSQSKQNKLAQIDNEKKFDAKHPSYKGPSPDPIPESDARWGEGGRFDRLTRSLVLRSDNILLNGNEGNFYYFYRCSLP